MLKVKVLVGTAAFTFAVLSSCKPKASSSLNDIATKDHTKTGFFLPKLPAEISNGAEPFTNDPKVIAQKAGLELSTGAVNYTVAADAKGDPRFFGELGEVAVDLAGALSTAGHAGDEQRSVELLSEQRRLQRDLRHRKLGHRAVQQLHALEQRRVLNRRHLFGRAQIQVRVLAAGGLGGFGAVG